MDRGAFVSRVAAERTTVAGLAQRFASDFAPYHYRGPAWRRKLNHLVERLGGYSLAALTPETVAAYRDARLKDPDPRYEDAAAAPRISGATVKTELDLLSKLIKVGEQEFGVPAPAGNPVHSIRKPSGGKGRDRRLTKVQWQALERECRASGNRWLWPAVQLAVETAMRRGELLGLQWKDVDHEHRIAMLAITKNGEARAVPLSSRALAVMDTLPRSLGGRVIDCGPRTLYSAFKAACDRAGIKDFTFHDLRHEALSRLAERGDFTVLELAAVSGHKTLQMLKRYTHLRAEKLAQKLG